MTEQEKHRVDVLVNKKPTVNDPEALTISGALRQLGYDASVASYSKLISLDIASGTREEAIETAREMASRILANPVIEEFSIITDIQREQ